jgi:hypothetical protein
VCARAAAAALGRAREIISAAIAIGVPAFNSGDTAACAAEYRRGAEAAIAALRPLSGAPAVAAHVAALTTALAAARADATTSAAAWTLRRAFDAYKAAEPARGGAAAPCECAACAKPKHCAHCKGGAGACACKAGCARGAGARCEVPPPVHCVHCKGGAGACACTAGCARGVGARCDGVPPAHCAHCRGGAGACACKAGCARGAGARCEPPPAHCAHCRGGAGACACTAGCARGAGARCEPALVNAEGRAVVRGEGGLHYCGARAGYYNACKTCDGRCGPTNGCACAACHALDVAAGITPFLHSAAVLAAHDCELLLVSERRDVAAARHIKVRAWRCDVCKRAKPSDPFYTCPKHDFDACIACATAARR